MVIQLAEVENWFSASGVLLVLARFPIESASVLTLTLRSGSGSSVLTFGDSSEFVNEDNPTTNFVLNGSVYIFAHRAHQLQSDDVA